MFILACYGLAVTLSIGKIFEPLRQWMKKYTTWGFNFIKCPMCTSFWIGIAISVLVGNLVSLAYLPTTIAVYNGLIACAGSFLLHCAAWRLALRDRDF